MAQVRSLSSPPDPSLVVAVVSLITLVPLVPFGGGRAVEPVAEKPCEKTH